MSRVVRSRSALQEGVSVERRVMRRLRQVMDTLVGGIILNRDQRRRIVFRKVLFDASHFFGPILFMQRGGVSYYVNTHDRVVSRQTFATGEYDEAVMRDAMALLERIGRPLKGRIFVDVGANIGTTTVPALIRFGAAKGIAIEPEPFNYRLLRCNLIANDLEDRVVSVRAAASDRTGAGRLQLSSWNSGDHRIRPEGVGPPAGWGPEADIAVPLERLDDLLGARLVDLNEIGVVWIDTQGHEGYVLTGAPKLVASRVPVLCEYWPYGLRRAENLEMFNQLVAEKYAWVVNIGDAGGGEPEWLPAMRIGELERSYPDQTFTDLILLKHGCR